MEDDEIQAPTDWHAFCSKQSFLLGQISGMVHQMNETSNINNATSMIDDLHCFIQNSVKQLYYPENYQIVIKED